MLRRILLVTVMVAATSILAVPVATAAQASGQCPAGGVKVTAGGSPTTITVPNTSTRRIPVDVVVTVTGTTFTITLPSSATYTLSGASWCLKAANSTARGSGTTGTSSTTNKNDVVRNINYVVVYSVTTMGNCYDGVVTVDVRVTGVNVLDGVALYRESTDGSCSGNASYIATLVSAATYTKAEAKCVALGLPGVDVTGRMSFWWPAAPTNWWFCSGFHPA